MSVMSDLATRFQLALDVFHDGVPSLTNYTSVAKLKNDYESQPGNRNWFHKDTLEFFGSSNLHIPAPGVTVEHQTEAPYDLRPYSVTAWTVNDDGRITPYTIDRFDDLETADYFAKFVSEMWDNEDYRSM